MSNIKIYDEMSLNHRLLFQKNSIVEFEINRRLDCVFVNFLEYVKYNCLGTKAIEEPTSWNNIIGLLL